MKLWTSRKSNKKAIEFAAGWDIKSKQAYDNILIPFEILVNKVYSKELFRKKYISKKEFEAIQRGLGKLLALFKKGKLNVKGYEDVHSLVESKLNSYNKLTGNMHLGKSRNDQISTIMKMWMRSQTERIIKDGREFVSILEGEKRKKGGAVIPGFSHHRVAMPTEYGFLLESYIEQLKRDIENLNSWKARYNECPLGSAAGFGSPLKINRETIAKELGFDRATKSSIDSVARWEAEANLAFGLSVLLNHLSALAQDFIYLSSAGINVITLPQEYCTGSSIMPQKINPDVLEVIKAKASVSQGILMSLLSIGKGSISGYNRDSQWTKYLIMDLTREFDGLFDVLGGLVKGIEINENNSKKLLKLEKAYAAEDIIKKCIKEKKMFRKEKLALERKLK